MNLHIPLDIHQDELITALADLFMDKKVPFYVIEKTLKGVLDLIARRMCFNVDPRMTWREFHQDEERRNQGE